MGQACVRSADRALMALGMIGTADFLLGGSRFRHLRLSWTPGTVLHSLPLSFPAFPGPLTSRLLTAH